MFGFKGTPTYTLQLEGYGQLHSGLYRFFGFGVCHKSTNYATKTRYIFDLDESGPDPIFISKSGFAQTAYDGTEVYPTFAVTAGNLSGGGIAGGVTYDTGEQYFRYNNGWEGVWMNGTATLTPATRKSMVVINRMDYVSDLTLSVINSAGTTATSNLAVQPLTFDLRGFTSLKGIYITTGYLNATASFKFPAGFTHFYFTGFSTTTINGTLPSSTKVIQIGSAVTSVTTLIQNATGCEIFTLGHPAGGYNGLTNVTTTLSGTLDVSHMTGMKVFMANGQPALTSLVLPSSTEWKWLHLASLPVAARAGFNHIPVLNALAATNCNIVYFANNGVTVNQNLNNSSISSNLQVMSIFGNTWTGDITLTTSKPNLREFRPGQSSLRTGVQQNSHTTIDISGLTNVRNIDIAGCAVSELTLPTNTVCTSLICFDNNLTRYYQKYINTNITSGWAVTVGAAIVTYGSDGDGNYVEIETTTIPSSVSGPVGANPIVGQKYRITWKYKTITDPYGGAFRVNGQADFVMTGYTVNVLRTESFLYTAIAGFSFEPAVVLTTFSSSVAGEKIRIYEVKIEEDLMAQVNAMTAITDLRFGNGAFTGQGSATGLEADVDLSGLTALTNILMDSCKLTGTFSLSTTPVINNLAFTSNPGLNSITANLKLERYYCPNTNLNYDFSQSNVISRIFSIVASNTPQSVVNLAARSSTTAISNFVFDNTSTPRSELTTINFPSNAVNCVFGTNGVTITNCTGLTTITDMDKISYSSLGLNTNSFGIVGCGLNITYPLGANNFTPRVIQLQNNAINNTNVNATIDSLYTNRTKWNGYSAAKSMNIGGSNAAPSGTYQAPAGFVLGSNDGTPASAKEQVYVLVNNYAWTITTN